MSVRTDGYWPALLILVVVIWSFATLPWIQDRTEIIVACSVLAGVLLEQRFPRVHVGADGIDLGGHGVVSWEQIDRVERGAIVFTEPLPVSKLLVPTGQVRRFRVTVMRTSAPLADAVARFAPDKLGR